MAINGADVLLRANTGTSETPVWTDVGAQRDATIEKQANMIDASHKGDDDEILLSGRRSSTMTLDAVYVPGDAAYAALLAAYKTGAKIKVRVRESGSDTEEAEAFIESLSLNHPDQDVSTVSLTLRVTDGWAEV